MLFHLLFVLFIELVSADEEIVQISHDCPPSIAGAAVLRIRADVPAFGEAYCKNGPRLFVSAEDGVEHTLAGSFDSNYKGQGCLLHKKAGSNTYTVEVEYGWGEEGSEVILQTKNTVMSCAYDHHGNALSLENKVIESMFAADEAQFLAGPLNKDADIQLAVMNVLDQHMAFKSVTLGRKIRLSARSKTKNIPGFRPVSCVAKNQYSNYAFLRAGCGDGLVIGKSSGFVTKGARSDSPFFRTFKLRGSDMMKFECNFTICKDNCDGDSCSTEERKRRDLPETDSSTDYLVRANLVTATSVNLRTIEDPNEPQGEEDILSRAFAESILDMGTNTQSWASWISNSDSTVDAARRDAISDRITTVLSIFGSVVILGFIMTLYVFVKRLLWPV